ncbi:TadE-like protein [Arthrobacter alpinus]|uniref:TadE-like protein n=1 Tax=Arthrobacter alpinus TaxID=656366 RepID=A0A1H5KP41_9MICC|nr:TadE family protein [Arthrobacter alpinus]SEE65738.1 TadE-like protein [Arthrobacter alpinus]
MFKTAKVIPRNPSKKQRGAAAVEFALILPLLLAMLFGVIDYGILFGQNMSLQNAAREGARQGILQGEVLTSTTQARGLLDPAKLQIKFTVDTTAGAPGSMVVCVRYPQSSLTGFFAWALKGTSQAKTVMRMEGTAGVTSGAKNWNGGSCTL